MSTLAMKSPKTPEIYALHPDEEILYEAKKSSAYLIAIGIFFTLAPFTAFGVMLLVFPPIVLIGPLLLGYVFFVRKKTRIVVTNRRVMHVMSVPFMGKRIRFQANLADVVHAKSEALLPQNPEPPELIGKLFGRGGVDIQYRKDGTVQTHTFTSIKKYRELRRVLNESVAGNR